MIVARNARSFFRKKEEVIDFDFLNSASIDFVKIRKISAMASSSNSRQQQSNYLVEFRAGKMYTSGGGETGAPITVHPDRRNGLVYIYRSDDTYHPCMHAGKIERRASWMM